MKNDMNNGRDFKLIIDGKEIDFFEPINDIDYGNARDEELLACMKTHTIEFSYKPVDISWMYEEDYMNIVALFYCLYWQPN